MKCNNCGYELQEADMFCPNCGKQIQKNLSVTKENETPLKKENSFFNKYKFIILGLLAIVVAAAIIIPMTSNSYKYNSVESLINKGKYDEAMSVLHELGDYKDCPTYMEYTKAFKEFGNENYEDAAEMFEELGDFHDSANMVIYSKAIENFKHTNYKTVIETLTPIAEYRDSKTYIDYATGKYNLNGKKYAESLAAFQLLQNATIKEYKKIGKDYTEYLNGMIKLYTDKDYAGAISIFTTLTTCETEDIGSNSTKFLSYIEGLKLYDQGEKYDAYQVFSSLRGFESANSYASSCSAERPKNKVLYRNKKYKSSSMSIKVKNNFDDDIFIKIYTTDNVLVGSMYVRAHGKTTIKLKPGKYIVKEAIGDYNYWFGTDYAFGPKGDYYVLKLTSDHDYYKFKKNYAYTITVGITGGNVGSYSESFSDF